MEQWKPVAGYEGYYEVSDFGNVRSLDREVSQRNGRAKKLKGRKLSLAIGNGNGNYLSVMLSKDGIHKRPLVHRLVAQAFIPNPHGCREVNHKDRNTRNNRADNLEWCTRQYNNTYGDIRRRMAETQGTAVLQLDHGVPIAWFFSQGEAARATGASQSGISACLRGICKTSGGFGWAAAK